MEFSSLINFLRYYVISFTTQPIPNILQHRPSIHTQICHQFTLSYPSISTYLSSRKPFFMMFTPHSLEDFSFVSPLDIPQTLPSLSSLSPLKQPHQLCPKTHSHPFHPIPLYRSIHCNHFSSLSPFNSYQMSYSFSPQSLHFRHNLVLLSPSMTFNFLHFT